MNRREMLGMIGILATGATGAAQTNTPEPAKASQRLFDVRTFGATGEGKILDSAAINRAIDACHDAGGGVVYVPPGIYLSGTVVLKSNVTFYLEAGATLLGSKDVADYTAKAGPPGRGDANQKHLIFAGNAENVTLAGPGRIDGQGPAFWVPSGRTPLPPEEAWRDVAAYVSKPLPRPSPMLEFHRCRNLRIEDVRIENSPGWTLRPINCDDVVIRGVAIKNPVVGSNTDGIDPTGCHNVFISDCTIDTGDDCICLKSENPYADELRVTKNITITNCVLTTCCNGLKFGTATHGGFENITFTNSVIYNDEVGLAARTIAGIAIEMVDGGWVEGVTISNIRMQRVRTPIFLRRGNRTPRADGAPGTLRGVMIENLHATGAILTSSVAGLPGFDVEDVTLANIRIDSEEAGLAEWAGRAIPENAKNYPESRMFGRLPSYGLYCRHVRGLRLRHLDLRPAKGEARPVLFCDEVKDLRVDGLHSGPIDGTQPTVKLVQTQQALLQNGAAPPATKTYLEVQGERTDRVVLMNSNLLEAEQAVVLGSNVPKNAVTLHGNAGQGAASG